MCGIPETRPPIHPNNAGARETKAACVLRWNGMYESASSRTHARNAAVKR
jgi:hypothetical protein